MARAASTGKPVYLYKLLTLTIDQGNTVARKIFDEAIGNVPLHQFFAQEMTTIKRLRANNVITKAQYDLFFPPIGDPPPSTADFDLTIVVCLLGNLNACGLNPDFNWNAPPQPGDTSLEADISRLKMLRNALVRISSTTAIDDMEFHKKWSDIEHVLLRLNGSLRNPIPNLQQCINDLKNGTLFPEEQNRKNEKDETDEEKVLRLQQELDEIRKRLEENQNQRPREKLFQSFYSDSRSLEEEGRQFASKLGHNIAPPGGNFIDTRELHVKETVFESSVLADVSNWVCMICFPGGTGTGFRVGTKYIMTANHVVKCILYKENPAVGQNQDIFAELQASGVYALFCYITDGGHITRQKFRFKAIVHFHDDNTDTAVLELEDNAYGTPMPLSFTCFSIPELNKKFTFIGHSEGKPMEVNHVDTIIDINREQTKRDLDQVNEMSLKHSGENYEVAQNTLTNPDRYLFHCKFTKGGSGSPGVVILEDGRVVVVTMLLCGFPDWYYDTSIPDHIKASWHKEYCLEQGVNMKSVYEKMLEKNPSLCNEIFSSHTDLLPNRIRY